MSLGMGGKVEVEVVLGRFSNYYSWQGPSEIHPIHSHRFFEHLREDIGMKKNRFNSGIARITPPPTPNSGNFTDFFRQTKTTLCAYGGKNTDDDNNCCHDNFDQTFGNFDDNYDKKY